MNYIYQFEIAAVLLDLVIIALYYVRNNYACINNKHFVLLVFCNFTSAITNLITVYTLAHINEIPLWFNYLINIIYLYTYVTSALLLFNYTIHLINKPKVLRIGKKLFTILNILEILILVTTPFTKLTFYFKDNAYYHGVLFNGLYAIGIFALIVVFALFIKYNSIIERRQLHAVFCIHIATVTAIVIQIIYQALLIQNFFIAMFFVVLYVCLQNPDNYIDRITNCLNKTAFYDTIERYISNKTRFCAVTFKLDDLSSIARLLDKKSFDEVTKQISSYFQQHFGIKHVYIIDEAIFAIMLDHNTSIAADDIITKINEKFSKPYSIDHVELMLTPYYCILDYPSFEFKTGDIPDILEYAYKTINRNSENLVITASAKALEARRRNIKITELLKQAIRNNKFQVFYQPIFNTHTRHFNSAEALIRLYDKELGFISPDEFISIAEHNGTIIEIGDIVFEKVCKFISENNLKKLGIDYIEINLSTLQCMQDGLAEHFISVMKKYNVSPQMINFEITETAKSLNEVALRKNIDILIEVGCTFSMDDYGTGFATANYLITLPMKIVKIDKSILWSAMDNGDAFSILHHTINMLDDLNKEIVVEGVETIEMKEMLVDMGVDFLQGFLFSKPVPSDQFIEFIQNNRTI